MRKYFIILILLSVIDILVELYQGIPRVVSIEGKQDITITPEHWESSIKEI
jgi:hypothetical protein